MTASLPVAAAFLLASHFAPNVAPDTIVTFAHQESGLRPLVVHDNTDGRTYEPETRIEAERIASRLINGLGHSVDLGIMQINSSNLPRHDLSIHDAFDPGHSMTVGAKILVEAYQRCNGEDARNLRRQRDAMLCAASVYNSGDEHRSAAYAARIFRTAQHLVPSLAEIVTTDFPLAAPGATSTVARPTPNLKPSTTADTAAKPAPASVVLTPGDGSRERIYVFTRN